MLQTWDGWRIVNVRLTAQLLKQFMMPKRQCGWRILKVKLNSKSWWNGLRAGNMLPILKGRKNKTDVDWLFFVRDSSIWRSYLKYLRSIVHIIQTDLISKIFQLFAYTKSFYTCLSYLLSKMRVATLGHWRGSSRCLTWMNYPRY